MDVGPDTVLAMVEKPRDGGDVTRLGSGVYQVTLGVGSACLIAVKLREPGHSAAVRLRTL